MRVDYIHGNPRKGNLNIKKPTMSQVKKIFNENVASNPTKKATKKATKKSSTKKTIKKVKKSSLITLDEAKKLFSKPTKSSQGGSQMAVKKTKKKVAKKAVAKKAVKKTIAKKAVKKVAKKAVKKVRSAAQKAATKKMLAAKAKSTVKKVKTVKRRKTKNKHLIHVKAMMNKGTSEPKIKKGRNTYSKSYAKKAGVKSKGGTKLPVAARFLDRGEAMVGDVFRTTARKDKKGGKHLKTKHFRYEVVRENPKRKLKKKKNPIVVSKNPIKFMKNPMGAVVAMESKVISALAPVNNMTEKFLNIGVLEIAGLGIGASLDGALHSLVKKIPKSDMVLSYIPEEYQAPAVTAMTGLLLHGLNSFLAKKGGKKSVILEEISKGMIASSLVKAFASMSKFSAENTAMEGYVHSSSMNGYIHSNPTSMNVSNSDFSGADFNGADFQGANQSDNVGGADFDGYVTAMSGEDDMDFGTDSSSMAGNW